MNVNKHAQERTDSQASAVGSNMAHEWGKGHTSKAQSALRTVLSWLSHLSEYSVSHNGCFILE
jgi:hypothetical protein